jgi:hypothetical protein
VVCVKNRGYAASLELRKLYQAIADEGALKLRQVRVIDESGEDYLYPEDYSFQFNFPNRLKEPYAVRPQNTRKTLLAEPLTLECLYGP